MDQDHRSDGTESATPDVDGTRARTGDGEATAEPVGEPAGDTRSPGPADAAETAETAEAEAEGAKPAEATDTAGDPAGRAARLLARTRGTALPVALAVLTVVLAGVAVWSGLKAHGLRTSAAARNTALTDSATTSEVNGQVTTAVNTIFSYDYNDLDKTQQAAQNLLTGQAICQYNKLFQVVRDQAPKQKLVVTVTVTNSAVELLQGDRARVLVFATQSDVRTSTRQSASAGAMFAVNAVHRDGRWRIEDIDTFTGAGSTQGC